MTCVDWWAVVDEMSENLRLTDRTRVPTCESWRRTRAHRRARWTGLVPLAWSLSTPRASSAVCTHVHRWIMTSSSFLPAHPQPQHGYMSCTRDTVRFRFSPRRARGAPARERVKPGLFNARMKIKLNCLEESTGPGACASHKIIIPDRTCFRSGIEFVLLVVWSLPCDCVSRPAQHHRILYAAILDRTRPRVSASHPDARCPNLGVLSHRAALILPRPTRSTFVRL